MSTETIPVYCYQCVAGPDLLKVVVKDGVASVAGKRGVLVFDARDMVVKGEAFKDLRMHFLRRGQAIDLATRKLQ